MLSPDEERPLAEKLLPQFDDSSKIARSSSDSLTVAPRKGANQTLALYIKHNPGVEIQLPYAEPLNGARNAFEVFRLWAEKMRQNCSATPTVSLMLLGILMALPFVGVLINISNLPLISIIGAVILGIAAIMGIPVSLTLLNLRLLYGRNWLPTLLGPTNVGVSRESIKLCWIGRFFSAYSMIVGWNEVLHLDAYRWSLADGKLAPKIRIKHKCLPGYELSEASFEITLSGFRDADQCRIFLSTVDSNVPDDRKSDLFKNLIRDLDPILTELQFNQSSDEEQPPRLLLSDS